MPLDHQVHPVITNRLRAAGCVFAEDEAALLTAEAPDRTALDAMVARRVAGEPLEYILGWAEFDGLRVQVDPGVFVPRRRTEYLVDQAVALAKAGSIVVDLCCGTGALGLTLAKRVAGLKLYAADIEAPAVACARRNLGGIGEVFEGDLFEALPAKIKGNINVLIANTPYVPSADIQFLPGEARDYEPVITLDGGSDGLDIQRRVAAAAAEWLAPDGHLLVEVGEDQADAAAAIMTAHGLEARIAVCEDYDAIVVIGTKVASQV